MRTLGIVLFLVLFLLADLIIMGVQWIWAKFNKRAADLQQLRLVQWAFRVVISLAGVKLEVKGHENVPREEAVLYVGNHRGFFDTVTTYSLCPGLTGYIAKDGINKVPILGMVMKRLYCLFLDRSDVKQGLKTILTAIDYVKDGVSICVFPEGTRNKDSAHPEETLEFKEGCFKIAQKTGCKIVPMAIIGSSQIFEDHLPWIRSGKVTVVYGEPIDVSSLPKEEKKHLGVYCRNVISQMLAEELCK